MTILPLAPATYRYRDPQRQAEVDRIRDELPTILARLLGADSIRKVARDYNGHADMIGKLFRKNTTRGQRERARRKKIRRGNAPRLFQPGHVPAYVPPKGTHFSPATEYRKGVMRGLSARRYRGLGTVTLRMRPGGGKPAYWIKVDERCERPQDRWIPLATAMWLMKSGATELPAFPDHVVHLDRDTLNNHPENLELMTPDESMAHFRTDKSEARRLERSVRARKLRADVERGIKELRGEMRVCA